MKQVIRKVERHQRTAWLFLVGPLVAATFILAILAASLAQKTAQQKLNTLESELNRVAIEVKQEEKEQ